MFRRILGEAPSLCFGKSNGSRTLRERYAQLWRSRNNTYGVTPLSLSIRLGSRGTSSSSSFSAKGPSQQLKSWESGAKLVQNTTVENKYLEHIRDSHDPSQHLKTIEDELKGTIGKALGKQAQKILMYTRLMEQERKKHEDLLLNEQPNDDQQIYENELCECAIAHNDYRNECLQARWELIVHRQAVGFTVGNYKFVHEKFPIGDALPVTSGGKVGGDRDNENDNKEAKQKFTDQLDWWSTIGRWK